MAKTIDDKIKEERKNKELFKKLKKRFPGPAPDLSDPKVCDEFCIRYGRAIAPELRKIDQWQARSLGIAFTKVVRGGYSNN